MAPKGFGSENMSRLKMFTPAAKPEDIVAFVKETVELAGSNPCPPVVLGVGIGGDFELVAMLAKKALCRSVSQRNPDPLLRRSWRKRCWQAVNETGVGPQGFGGRDHRPGGEYRGLSHPHRRAARGGERGVPCHPPQDSGAVILISPQYIPLHIAIFWIVCYNEVRKAGGFLRVDEGFPPFQI